jgi:hypothetical protein
MFLLQMWVLLCLGHRCSELRDHLDRYFSSEEYEGFPYFFLLTLVESLFYYILEWLLQLASWFHLLGNLFFFFSEPFTLRLCVYLYCWSVFLVCSKWWLLFLFIVLACVFLLGNWVHWCWEILMISDCYLLFFWCWWYLCVGMCVLPLLLLVRNYLLPIFSWMYLFSLGWSFASRIFYRAWFVDWPVQQVQLFEDLEGTSS